MTADAIASENRSAAEAFTPHPWESEHTGIDSLRKSATEVMLDTKDEHIAFGLSELLNEPSLEIAGLRLWLLAVLEEAGRVVFDAGGLEFHINAYFKKMGAREWGSLIARAYREGRELGGAA
ncbi:MAG: hypothetical protein RIB60_07620 [Phycisphaerales bacterium]